MIVYVEGESELKEVTMEKVKAAIGDPDPLF